MLATDRLWLSEVSQALVRPALLEHLAANAAGCRMARAAGVESEMELAYAGLHQLLASVVHRSDGLPSPQRDALRTAFGLSDGQVPDRFLVGLATLSLLAEVAEDHPLVCVVDDEQWLDRASAQVLGFVARRLKAEPVGMVFATRVAVDDLAGLPEVVLRGLDDADARDLLAASLSAPLDTQVASRLVADAGGNPLALLELPRGLTPAELAGGFALPNALPLAGRIEASFQRRLESLPEETRQILLVAAAEPIGDPVLVWRAAERLGLSADAAAPAAEAGLPHGVGYLFTRVVVWLARSSSSMIPGSRSAISGAAQNSTVSTPRPGCRRLRADHRDRDSMRRVSTRPSPLP